MLFMETGGAMSSANQRRTTYTSNAMQFIAFERIGTSCPELDTLQFSSTHKENDKINSYFRIRVAGTNSSQRQRCSQIRTFWLAVHLVSISRMLAIDVDVVDKLTRLLCIRFWLKMFDDSQQ